MIALGLAGVGVIPSDAWAALSSPARRFAKDPQFHSLLSCFEADGMAQHCVICQGEGRLAYTMHEQGKTLDEIRAAIDERFGQ